MTRALRYTAAGLLLASLTLAHADGTRTTVKPLPAYQQECASCHIAYPPGLLPASSWQRLMGSLATHYGSDASIDAPLTAAITAWLAANAGTGQRNREAAPDNRITRSAWFVREHREVGAATWALPAVKSAANCAACHTAADQGDFDEDRIRMPR
jgi:Dihaem cytochrome c